MMNSKMSLAVRQGLSMTTAWPQFSSRSTLLPGSTSAMTAAPETSTTWPNAGQSVNSRLPAEMCTVFGCNRTDLAQNGTFTGYCRLKVIQPLVAGILTTMFRIFFAAVTWCRARQWNKAEPVSSDAHLDLHSWSPVFIWTWTDYTLWRAAPVRLSTFAMFVTSDLQIWGLKRETIQEVQSFWDCSYCK